MSDDTKNRTELKSYFVTNAIPTEANFAELIDGTLNLAGDGISRQPGGPLRIEAVDPATEARRPALALYDSFDSAEPAWTLNLAYWDGGSLLQLSSGLSFEDGQGESRLFIDQTNGNVGIGTHQPEAKLDVAGDIRVHGQKPIRMERYDNLGSNVDFATEYLSTEYAAAIVGFAALGGQIFTGRDADPITAAYLYQVDELWHVHADLRSSTVHPESWSVDVMFISRSLVEGGADWVRRPHR